ncbi:MAG: NAD(P)-binding protein [Peptococcaceae bacterium]|nr:NAD(P)-binding protein [Peptococcaceae bacterium]MDH7525949.1 NAD(P)-binding protein [Peptococcaceae bacterium]
MEIYRNHVLVCGGGGCVSSGCEEVAKTLQEEMKKYGIDKEIKVVITGCMGPCALGPMMIVYPDGIFYKKLTPDDVREIVEKHLYQGNVVERLLFEGENDVNNISFFSNQVKIALRNVGIVDPNNIEHYIARDGYFALARVLGEMEPAQVIRHIKESGLRGRGGAGFPTGLKWELAARSAGPVKYVVCNADEGDPGAYMDRSIIEGDPHSLIEGMIIGGYAIGANKGFVYIRAEYPLAVEHLDLAIRQAREKGFLGGNIFDSGFSFDIEIRVGAGAFVCGEETALLRSIEGERGEPRPKPPFPADRGLWQKPTVINNVETWANVPPIILNGTEWFKSVGTAKSPGTKVFALAGKIENSGLVEVPMGATLGEVIFEVGGGIPKGKKFKAAQTGGPSGGCIPIQYLNVPMDYESLTELGTIMGSGGLIVMDEDTCMVDLAKFFLEFVQEESCGKCVPCRVGTKRMLEILENITRGKGQPGDIEKLEKLGKHIKDTALCGLGQTAPNPVLSTICYFREEYEEHIKNKYCRASVCASLFVSPCQNSCPAGIDVPRYIEAVQRKAYADAVDIIREDNPFPSVCGRVCNHPCERRCQRGQLDAPVGIRYIKRFAGDYELANWEKSIKRVQKKMAGVTPNGKKVAVVGSGPAGLTVAYFLAKWGYKVMVIEEQPVLGGMLALTIPAYRLPRDILNKEIEWILAHGIDVMLNTSVGKDISLSSLVKEYDAVFVGIGCHKDSPLDVPGEDLPEVYSALSFLKDVCLGHEVQIGKRVAVIGGGNSAIDAARVAKRLGAREVSIIYRRNREDMPAEKSEIEDAANEGIEIHCLTTPVRVIEENGHVVGLECIRLEPGQYDKSGRRTPVPVEGSNFVVEIDTVITAVGLFQDIENLVVDDEITLGSGKVIEVDKESMMTSIPGVFAGGDCVRGPETVISAIADGRKAAQTIDRYLGGKNYESFDKRQIKRELYQPVIEGERERINPTILPPEQRKFNFDEVEATLTEKEVQYEASRCLRCDVK